MIDPKNKERILVRVDQEFGPYVCLPRSVDAKKFEEALERPPCALFLKENKKELTTEGEIYYFCSIADPVKVQEFIDKIVLDN